jgi:prepilin-type N-terminal cleavage/methylation domain-containing protein
MVQGRREAGMSLLEVLIAMALMAVVALGILPLFSRSVRQNREGGNYTELTNVARSSLEEYLQLDFNAPALAIAAGSTEKVVSEYWSPVNRRWITFPADATTVPATARFQRTVSIRQYGSGDLVENGRLDTPLDGATARDLVQLKLIRVTVRPLWQNSEGFGKRTPLALEVIKAI